MNERLEFEPTRQPIFSDICYSHIEECVARLEPQENKRSLHPREMYISNDILDIAASCFFQLRRHGILWIPSDTLIDRKQPLTRVSNTEKNDNVQNERPSINRYFESRRFSGDILGCALPLHDSTYYQGSPRIVLFPINSPGTHWSLAAYYRDNKASQDDCPVVYYYDSIFPGVHPLSQIGVEQYELLTRLLILHNAAGVMGRTPCCGGEETCTFITHDPSSIEIEHVRIPPQTGDWECGIYVLLLMDMIVQRACSGNYAPIDETCDFSHFTQERIIEMQRRMHDKLCSYANIVTNFYEKVFSKCPKVGQEKLRNVSKWFGVKKVPHVRDSNNKASSHLSPAENLFFIGDIPYSDLVNMAVYSSMSHRLLTYLCSRSVYTLKFSGRGDGGCGGGIGGGGNCGAEVPFRIGKKRAIWHHSVKTFFSSGNDSISKEAMHFLVLAANKGTRYVLLILYCGKVVLYDPSSAISQEQGKTILGKTLKYYKAERDYRGSIGNKFDGESGWVNTNFESACVVFLVAEYSLKAGNFLPKTVSENILSLFTRSPFKSAYVAENLKKYFVSLLNTDYVELHTQTLYVDNGGVKLPHPRKKLVPTEAGNFVECGNYFVKKPIHSDLMSGFARAMKYDWSPGVFLSVKLNDILQMMQGTPSSDPHSHSQNKQTNTGWDVSSILCKVNQGKQHAIGLTFGELLDLFFPHKEVINASAYSARATDTPTENVQSYWENLLSCVPRVEIFTKGIAQYLCLFEEKPRLKLRKGLLLFKTFHRDHHAVLCDLVQEANWEDSYAKNPDFWKFHCNCLEFSIMSSVAAKDIGSLNVLLSSIPHVLMDGPVALGNIISLAQNEFMDQLFRLVAKCNHPSPQYVFGVVLLLYPIKISPHQCNPVSRQQGYGSHGKSPSYLVINPVRVSELLDPTCGSGWLSKAFFGADYPQTLIDRTYYSQSLMLLEMTHTLSEDPAEVLALGETISHLFFHHYSQRQFGSGHLCPVLASGTDRISSSYGIKKCCELIKRS